MSATRIYRELQQLSRVWNRELTRADVEGTRIWLEGVVFGLKMAVQVAKRIKQGN